MKPRALTRGRSEINYRFVKINFGRRLPEGIFALKLKNYRLITTYMDVI